MTKTIWLALGANAPGTSGSPRDTLANAIAELAQSNMKMIATSSLFKTVPIGPKQPPFLNMVCAATTDQAPAMLLRTLKRIERAAGRRPRGRWTARPLDIDIIAFKGARNAWPARRTGSITIPHPEIAFRAFVLVPLLSIDRTWVHNAKRQTGRQLLQRLPLRDRLTCIAVGDIAPGPGSTGT